MNSISKEFQHPERQINEVFLFNNTAEYFNQMPYKTKRLGSRTFDGVGNSTQHPNWFPIFIAVDELNTNGQTVKGIRDLMAKGLLLSRSNRVSA